MRTSHVLFVGTVALGMQGLALPAWAAPYGDKFFVSDVDTCNTLLDPYAGLDLSVSLPADGPREFWVDIAPFTSLTQYLGAIAADPNRTGKPATLDATVTPSGDDLAARFSDPGDGRSSTPLVVHATPVGAIHASFDDPPEPADDPPEPAFTALTVDASAVGTVHAAFDNPPDWSMPAPTRLVVDSTVGGLLHAVFDDPPEPADDPPEPARIPLAVDANADGTVKASFDYPPDWSTPAPASLWVSTEADGTLNTGFDNPPDWDRPAPLRTKTQPDGNMVASFFDDPPDWSRSATLLTVKTSRTDRQESMSMVFDNPPDWDRDARADGVSRTVDVRFDDPPDWDRPAPARVVSDSFKDTLDVYLDDPPEPALQFTVHVDTEALASMTFVDSNGRQLQLTYAQTTSGQ